MNSTEWVSNSTFRVCALGFHIHWGNEVQPSFLTQLYHLSAKWRAQELYLLKGDEDLFENYVFIKQRRERENGDVVARVKNIES